MSYKYANFDSDGILLGYTYRTPLPEAVTYFHILDEGRSVRHWFDGDTVRECDPQITIPPWATLNDVVTFTIPFPEDVIFTINGVLQTIPLDGVVTLDTSTLGPQELQLSKRITQPHLFTVISQAHQDRITERVNIKADVLTKSSPAQIDNWIDTNVTDMASARTALKVLAKAVFMLYRDT